MRLVLALLSTSALVAADPTWVQVKAVLEARCTDCHGETKQKGGLRLDSPEWLLKGGHDGKVLVAGKPESSKLYTLAAAPLTDDDKMPPKGPRLTDEQLAILKGWITAGASVEPVAKTDTAVTTATASAHPLQLPVPVPTAPTIPAGLLEQLSAEQIKTQTLAGGWLDINAAHTKNGITQEQLTLLAKTGGALAYLDLAGSGITDKQLASLRSCPNLIGLHLERNPQLTDAAIPALLAVPSLISLNLVGTGITDAGTAQLAKLGNLRAVYLWQTKVTPAGATALRAALPEATILLGPDDLPAEKLAPKKKKK
jgi:mono/diheme cytochrome c family protein